MKRESNTPKKPNEEIGAEVTEKVANEDSGNLLHKIVKDSKLIYPTLYCLGARIIRISRRIKRRVKDKLNKCKWKIRRAILDRKEQKHLFPEKRFLHRVFAPITDTRRNLIQRKKQRQTGHAEMSLKQAWSPFLYLMSQIFHTLLPAAAAVFLINTIVYYGKMNYALRVEYNGEYVGYISSESDFALAENQMLGRVIAGNYEHPENAIPQYSFESIELDQLTPLDLLTNNMISVSGNEIEEAAGVYVDDKFIGAVSDDRQLLMNLKALKEEDRTANPGAEVSFVQDFKLSKGLYPVASVIGTENVMEILLEQQGSTVTYSIQPGDTPYELAERFDVPMQNILDLNPDVTKNMHVGEELIIEKPAPFLAKKMVKTMYAENEILYSIETETDKNKDASYEEKVQEGKNGLKRTTSEVVYIDGCETERRVVSEDVIVAAVNEKIVVGSLKKLSLSEDNKTTTKTTDVVLSNSSQKNMGGYIWPVSGGKTICSIQGYSGHTGNDIGADAGTAIWASKAGEVVYSDWSRGYGYNVLIQHPDGTKTRYAHCSTLQATVGQQVSQGQQIAQVGRTGNASANHCHFEIIQNGQFLDPRPYIGY